MQWIFAIWSVSHCIINIEVYHITSIINIEVYHIEVCHVEMYHIEDFWESCVMYHIEDSSLSYNLYNTYSIVTI